MTAAKVFLDYDQAALDRAYDQPSWAPNMQEVLTRRAAAGDAVRARLGAPRRLAYGSTPIEQLDVYVTSRITAPVMVFLHGGAWRGGDARSQAFAAETFVRAGAHFVVPDFATVMDIGLDGMVAQVRRAVAWVASNAASFGGDTTRIYVGGHSSGGHLASNVLITDWASDFGLPADVVKGGLCMSGLYDMKPVRLSKRSSYVKFTDAMEDAMSSRRHIERLRAPIIVTYGTYETPEFQRQSRDFAAAVKSAGKPVELVEAPNYDHFEMCETLGHPYGPNGRAALRLMKLA